MVMQKGAIGNRVVLAYASDAFETVRKRRGVYRLQFIVECA